VKSNDVFDYLFNKAEESVLIGCSKHAAALVYKGSILCTGVSKQKSHPLMKRFSDHEKKIYLHAEIDVIVRAISRYGVEILPECSLFVLRISRGGNIGLSKPCAVCARAIDAFKIKEVYWSENNVLSNSQEA
jgi:tRNA(Arg) A34 adenosine deaminase TadA